MLTSRYIGSFPKDWRYQYLLMSGNSSDDLVDVVDPTPNRSPEGLAIVRGMFPSSSGSGRGARFDPLQSRLACRAMKPRADLDFAIPDAFSPSIFHLAFRRGSVVV